MTSQIAKDARQRLAAFKVPERIFFLKDLPKGISGKVQRRALKEMSSTAAPVLIIGPTSGAIL